MRALIDEAGLANRISVDSAGTSTEELGHAVDRRAVKEAARRGITLEHVAWQFQPEDFDRYDLVLVADDMTRFTLDSIAVAGFGHRFNSFEKEELDSFLEALGRAGYSGHAGRRHHQHVDRDQVAQRLQE